MPEAHLWLPFFCLKKGKCSRVRLMENHLKSQTKWLESQCKQFPFQQRKDELRLTKQFSIKCNFSRSYVMCLCVNIVILTRAHCEHSNMNSDDFRLRPEIDCSFSRVFVCWNRKSYCCWSSNNFLCHARAWKLNRSRQKGLEVDRLLDFTWKFRVSRVFVNENLSGWKKEIENFVQGMDTLWNLL